MKYKENTDSKITKDARERVQCLIQCQNPFYKTSDPFCPYTAQILPNERVRKVACCPIFSGPKLHLYGTMPLPAHKSLYYLSIKCLNIHFFSIVSPHLCLERGSCSFLDELLDDFMPLVSSPSIQFISFIPFAKNLKDMMVHFICLVNMPST